MHTHKPRDLTIASEVWGCGPQSKTPHRNTGNDISYVLQDTQRKRERGAETVKERECWESEWEFLSGNRAFTVSYYTEKRRKRRRVNGG